MKKLIFAAVLIFAALALISGRFGALLFIVCVPASFCMVVAAVALIYSFVESIKF